MYKTALPLFCALTMIIQGSAAGDLRPGISLTNDTIPAFSWPAFQKGFASPGAQYGSAPLWVWNTKVTNGIIDSMLQGFKGNAFGGVFVHPRAGLITEYLSEDWFALWKHTVDKARQLGLEVWIYDENSYPSGFAGGHVPDAMPESYNQGEMLELHKDSIWPGDGSKYLIVLKKAGDHFVPASGDPAGSHGSYFSFKKTFYYTSPWYGGFSYVDLLAKGVTAEFINQTMPGYERVVGDQFGKAVKGIFSDEPNIEVQYPNSVRWTPDLFSEFEARWGYRLEDHLPSLLEEEGDWKKVRHDYYAVLLQLFINRWAKPFSEYTASHHLEWTGHVWEHEWPDPNHGPDNMAMYAWPQRPGIDMLFNQFDETKTNAQFGNVRSVKELSSVTNQLGKGRNLSETYGGGGWELRFKDLKRLGDWEFVLGVNTLNQHLAFMSISGSRKYDYPQSFSYHNPWWPYYKYLNQYFTRLTWALTRGEQVNKVLVIEPTSTMWMYAAYEKSNVRMQELGTRFQTYITGLEKAQVEYDLGCEDIMRDHGSVTDGQLVIGKRAYSTVVIPPGMENIDSATLLLLKKFAAAGGRLLVHERVQRMNGGESPLTGWLNTDQGGDERLRTGELDIKMDAGGDLYHHRRIIDGGEILFLSNSDMDTPARGTFSIKGKKLLQMDLFGGAIKEVPASVTGGRLSYRYDLPPAGSALFLITDRDVPVEKSGAELSGGATTVVKTGPMSVVRPAENSLMIDFCDVRIGGSVLKDQHVYYAADTVYKFFGFSEGSPWNTSVQFRHNTVSRDTFGVSGGGFEVTYHFNIQEGVPAKRFRVVTEQPELWQVLVNGHVLQAEKGQWWLDKSFGVYAGGAYMHAGENTIQLKASKMSVNAEIEPVYVLGDFGLASASKGWKIVAPSVLHEGSWKDQGMPLYGQSVTYVKELDVQPGGKRFAVKLGKWSGTVATVTVNGSFAGIIAYDPYTLDISALLHAGQNKITVTVVGSLKNLLGPHHNKPRPGLVSPWHWRQIKSYPAGKDYDTYDYGLMEAFEVVSGK